MSTAVNLNTQSFNHYLTVQVPNKGKGLKKEITEEKQIAVWEKGESNMCAKDICVLLWEKLQKIDQESLATSEALERAEAQLPSDARHIRIQYGVCNEKPLYAYSKEEIVEKMDSLAQVHENLWGDKGKQNVFKQKECLIDKLSKEEARVIAFQKEVGYVAIKKRDQELTKQFHIIDDQLANTVATTLEGVYCQVKRLFEFLSLDINEPEDRIGEYIKSIKIALDKQMA